MVRLIIVAIFLFLSIGSAIAKSQKFVVEGIVVDSVENQTVAYAVLRIDRLPDASSAIELGVSDDNGAFSEKLPEAGKYRLTVSATGYLQRMVDFAVSDTAAVCNLGQLNLASVVKLKEVNVTAKKQLVKAEIDKIAYSVEDDPEAGAKTVIQMLRKVPMVTVDGQDNIMLKGSANFKVYVNGKLNTMMSNNPKEVLRSLPASSVKSIEVITDPGAKYDADGVGGIINIVTQGARMQGYNLSVGVTGSNNGPSAYTYGSLQIGKLTMSADYSYNYEKRCNGVSSGYERVDYDGNHQELQTLLNNSHVTGDISQMHYGSLSGSYEADSLNLVTFNYDFYTWRDNSHGLSSFRMLDASQSPSYSYATFDFSHTEYASHSLGVDYQHSFMKKGELLTVSYKYDKAPMRNLTETSYADEWNVPFPMQAQRQDNKSHSSEHTLQADYVNPVNEHHYVDAGMKFIARKNASSGQSILLDGDNPDVVEYGQRQSIVAAYADYNLKVGSFSLKAGVRYEHMFMSVDYELQPDRNFGKGFDDVVPSAAMSYSLSPTSNVRVGYNMRLNRPGIWFLNPFRQSATPNDVRYGNPDLSTSKNHGLILSYNIFTSKVNLNADIRHEFVNNGVTEYSFVSDGVRNTTYGNYMHCRRTSLSVWMNWTVTQKTSLMLSASGSYMDVRSAVLDARNSGFFGNVYAQFQQKLPWKLDFTLYGGGGTPRVSLQGKSGGYNFYGLTLTRSFLKDDRMEVSLFASDFLKARKSHMSTTITDSYRQSSHSRTYACRFGVSISWRFGSMDIDVKRTKRTINNDDVMKGGDKGKTQQ